MWVNKYCPVCGFEADGYSHYPDCPMLDLCEYDQSTIIELALMDDDYLEITSTPHFRNGEPKYQHNYELMRFVGWMA